MDVDHLEEVLRNNPRTKMIYTVPDFQNPTGVTMSLARRHRLIELANQFDVLVLEDSPYRSLRFEGTDIPTLKSLDTEGRVVYLGSFSKILAPGMRLGWAVASGEVLAKLARLKLAADTQCSTLNMMAASMFLERHPINDHIAEVRCAYKRKRKLMLECWNQASPSRFSTPVPTAACLPGSPSRTGFDTAKFMIEHALPQAKVVYVPGAAFFALEPETNHARFNFSALPEAQLIAGMERLGKLLCQAIG